MKLIKAIVHYPKNNIILGTIDNVTEVRNQIWGSSFKNQHKASPLLDNVQTEFREYITQKLIDSLVLEYNKKTYKQGPSIDYPEKHISYDENSLEIDFISNRIIFQTSYGGKKAGITMPDEFNYSSVDKYKNVAIMYCKKDIILSMLFED